MLITDAFWWEPPVSGDMQRCEVATRWTKDIIESLLGAGDMLREANPEAFRDLQARTYRALGRACALGAQSSSMFGILHPTLVDDMFTEGVRAVTD